MADEVLYVVVVNRNVERRQGFSLFHEGGLQGRLESLETDRYHDVALGDGIELEPGDGRIYRFVPAPGSR